MKLKVIAIAISLTFCACSNVKIEQIGQITEIEPTIKKNIPVIFDNILSDFSLLKLNTPEGVFLGSIDIVKFSKNRIFIADVRMMNSVFIFDQYGSYINHIEGGYKGPGEFIRPQSITTEYETDGLYVFDDKLKKILCYDSQGDFVSEFKFKYTANEIAHISKDLYAFNAGFPQLENKVNSHDLLLVSGSGRVQKKFLKLRSWRKGTILNRENTFMENMDTTWYNPVYNDTIYHLTETGPIPKFHIHLGKRFIDDDLAKKIDLDDPYSEYIHTILSFQKAEQTIYYEFGIQDPESGRNVVENIFYNLDSHNSKAGQFLTGKEISHGLFTGPIASNGEYFISSLDAFSAKRRMKDALNYGAEFSEETLEFFDNLSENDNPILMFYKVAPF